MYYVSDDTNYTDPSRSGLESNVERVGDLTADTPDNKTTNKKTASKLANLLEGLEFPATKEEIKDHINRKSPAMGNRINDVFEAVNNNLEDSIPYNSAYEIEMAAKLVEKI